MTAPVVLRLQPKPLGHHGSRPARSHHPERMAALIAFALMAAIIAALAKCEPARASEPLPDMRATNATLERVLPVLLSARATEDAVLVVAIHQGRLTR